MNNVLYPVLVSAALSDLMWQVPIKNKVCAIDKLQCQLLCFLAFREGQVNKNAMCDPARTADTDMYPCL